MPSQYSFHLLKESISVNTPNTSDITPGKIFLMEAIALELHAGIEAHVVDRKTMTVVSPPGSSSTVADDGSRNFDKTQKISKPSQALEYQHSAALMAKQEPVASGEEEKPAQEQEPQPQDDYSETRSSSFIFRMGGDGAETIAFASSNPYDPVPEEAYSETRSSSFVFRMGGDGAETIPFESSNPYNPVPEEVQGRYVRWFDQYRGRWVTRWQPGF